MRYFVHLLMIPFFICFLKVPAGAQENYSGTIVTKFKDKYSGTLVINLNSSNDELIKIETKKIRKSNNAKNKTKQDTTESFKLNVALISYIIIHDTTYYFRDLTYDYQSKKYMNCCMRLLTGNLDCGIFQKGNTTDINNRAIKLPNRELSELVSINFDYYTQLSGWTYLAFRNCKELKEKISAKQNGYSWANGTDTAGRLVVWENWIKEFNACKP